jgi:hypothetical protein
MQLVILKTVGLYFIIHFFCNTRASVLRDVSHDNSRDKYMVSVETARRLLAEVAT